MGCFSWVLLDTRKEMVAGQPFKLLVPEVFGGGSIESVYEDYGHFNYEGKTFDLYEVIGFWNFPELMKGTAEHFGAPAMDVEVGVMDIKSDTDHNRSEAIDRSCYDRDAATLKYPLRLVSTDDTRSYEDYDGMFSISAPDQGWNSTTIYDEARFEVASYQEGAPQDLWRDEHHDEDYDDED